MLAGGITAANEQHVQEEQRPTPRASDAPQLTEMQRMILLMAEKKIKEQLADGNPAEEAEDNRLPRWRSEEEAEREPLPMPQGSMEGKEPTKPPGPEESARSSGSKDGQAQRQWLEERKDTPPEQKQR